MAWLAGGQCSLAQSKGSNRQQGGSSPGAPSALGPRGRETVFEEVGQIGNGKSASRVESTAFPTGLVPGQSDHSPRFENAACNPSSVPLSAQKRARAETEFAPVRRRLGDRAERMSSEGRAVQGMEARTPWPSPLRLPK